LGSERRWRGWHQLPGEDLSLQLAAFAEWRVKLGKAFGYGQTATAERTFCIQIQGKPINSPFQTTSWTVDRVNNVDNVDTGSLMPSLP